MQFPSKLKHSASQILKEQFSAPNGNTKSPGYLEQAQIIKEFMEVLPSLISNCTKKL